MRDDLRRARRVAGLAAGATLALAVGKYCIGRLVNSPALQADGVDSTTDTLALATSWVGLYIASREPSERFPFGFYRAENIGAFLVAGLIMLLGVRYGWHGLSEFGTVPELEYSAAGLAMAAVSVAAAFLLFLWQRKAGRETGSQSLEATAAEMRLDMVKSGVVFVAVLCSRFDLPYVESLVTLGIAALILKTGFKNMKTAVLSLMDASVDPELEEHVAEIIEDVPGVRWVEKVHSRRSGPFYFVEGHVHVKSTMEVERSHAVVHKAADRVEEAIPRVEGVILHVEPYRGSRRHVLAPVEADEGLESPVCRHFGRAPFFAVVRLNDSEIKSVHVEANRYSDKEVRAGLSAVRDLVRHHEVDIAVVREIGEISFHALRDNGVDVYVCSENPVEGALRAFCAGELELLSKATHPSEQTLD
ncbi:MAG: cation diffusion facilitator family transporter [Planctomycetota bacterium]